MIKGPANLRTVTFRDQYNFWTWGDNYLCEPPDPAFQAWIDAVPSVHSTGILCEPASQQVYLPLVAR